MSYEYLFFLMTKKNNIELVLKDGSVFSGFSFGADTGSAGEVVFNTGMVGYPESLTDPSYKGQILVLTYPLIGNYGVPAKDKDSQNILKYFESDKIQVKGLIISDYSREYSHWNAVKSLSDWLKEENIPGIYGIDTRALTKKLREKGTMLGKIVSENSDVEFYNPNKADLVKEVSINEPVIYASKNHNDDINNKKVVLVDCGAKNNIINCLLKRNVTVMRVPYDYDFFDHGFDGIVISNGPGDPKMNVKTIENIGKAIEMKIPIFGICLGNQILALAAGGDTYKLKYGHRSQNQPCLIKGTKRCFITTQNHGFAVDMKKMPNDWDEWFVNVNDGTNEGIKHKTKPFMSVQFHPEAMPGPVDTEFLFDEFIKKLNIKNHYEN